MRWGFVAIFALLTLLPKTVWPEAPKAKDEADLAVINAGVAAADDAPFATPSYEFYPGEMVYVSFEISGFHVDKDDTLNTQRIALEYDVQLQDAQNRLLAPAKHDTIQVQLSPEDKNWIPKRRAEFQLPALLPAGTYQLHVAMVDTLGHTHAVGTVPFHVGGERITVVDSLSVQHFRFMRSEDSGNSLEVPAYRPGDTVFVAFDLAGFATGAGNRYRLTYTLAVNAPDGKPFLKESPPIHVEDGSFYPAQYVPINLQVATNNASSRGVYTLALRVLDQIANHSQQFSYNFTLE